jgi:predicted flap endonuclease-1-like 5' DNA nuclease/uncharacterized coiled-coil protein SlyX
MTAASSMNERALDDSVGDDSTRSRASGIVDVLDGGVVERSPVDRSPAERGPDERSPVERSPVDRQPVDRQQVAREASPVASAVESGTNRDEDIEITTEHGDHAKTSGVDDDTIEVSDDEIETAEPSTYRPSMPSLSSYELHSSNGSSPPLLRSRPPARPSSRPRPPSGSSLPPPRSSRPSGFDPWALANRTLELSHANARISELEELVAFRDARISELEDDLLKARRKVEDLEQRLFQRRAADEPSRASAVSVGDTLPAIDVDIGAETEVPVITETRPAMGLRVSDADGSRVPLPEGVVRKNAGRSAARVAGDVAGELAADVDRDSGALTVGGAPIVRGASEDDLQQISGIGPRFEAALRKQGITRLSQIAAWSEADVRQVAKALKIPKSRIVKGRWVEVAREVIGTRSASE